VFDGCLRGEQKTEHVNVKHLVELFFGDGLDGGELVYAGVVNEDVEAAIVFDGGVDDALRLSSLGDVAPQSDSLATGCGDGGDNSVRASLAGSSLLRMLLLRRATWRWPLRCRLISWKSATPFILEFTQKLGSFRSTV
jgi:hypothetical protein